MSIASVEQLYLPFMAERPVAVIGAGVMGAKVAWVCAKAGISTRLYDVDHQVGLAAKERALGWGSDEDKVIVAKNLIVSSNLDEALEGVQLAFENVPEKLDLKTRVLAEVSSKLNKDAYMGTNASSITCKPLAEASGRPDRFFNMNYADPLESPMVELMGSEHAAPETLKFAKDWAKYMGMVALHVEKEQLGYSFNRLWRVIKKETLRQLDNGITTPENIDRAWMLSFGMDIGPCGIMDEVGLHTVLSIEEYYYQESGDESDRPPKLLVDMVKAGTLGSGTGQGFYSHPDPAYKKADFLKG